MSNKLMLGLWRYVLHVPPFIWQKQIEKGKRRFETEYRKMPKDFRNVHHFVVRELPRIGKPLPEGMIAGELGIAIDRVRGSYMRVNQMVEVTRIIQSAIFGFDPN